MAKKSYKPRIRKDGKLATQRWGKYSSFRPKAPAIPVPVDSATLDLAVVPPSNGQTTLPAPINKRERTIRGLPPNSKIRKAALHAIAMRIGGHTDEEIGQALGLSAKTIPSYLYIAGKKGWLDYADPKDRMEYQLQHKVVDNLNTLMDSPDDKIRMRTTISVAEGTLYKRFGEQAKGVPQQTNMLSIKIEVPTGAQETLREGAVGGRPAYISGEVIDAEDVLV